MWCRSSFSALSVATFAFRASAFALVTKQFSGALSVACTAWQARATATTAATKNLFMAFSPLVIWLPAERCFPTIHFGLRDVPRFNQRRNARVRQFVSVLAHAVFETLGFESPLMAKFPIIIRAMLYVFVGCLRRVDAANNQSKGNKQYCAVTLHEQTLLLWNSPSDWQSRFFEGEGSR
jgi:hypothetical protein